MYASHTYFKFKQRYSESTSCLDMSTYSVCLIKMLIKQTKMHSLTLT